MAVIKCKMCGGTLNITEGLTVAECEYCGSRQTIPTADNEKKMTLFTRAARLLRGCEFDKAAGVFEAIVADFPEEAEAYWGLVLCKYGIEYVDDPATGKKIPTCHRSGFDSVLDDENFEQACENTDAIARRVYRDEARQIEELRKAIIEVSGKEEPYDIFISYKETDTDGQRTLDSVLAQDIYTELTEKGYRVFFSRISLEDKLGTEYEPYIFAALNSAKLMLVVGTDYEHLDAVWVKNEWSRFLKLMASGQKKVLIPVFKNMDAYDMPKEFAKLAAQDMGKIGAMQDLLRGVEKLLGKRGEAAAKPVEQVIIRESGSGPNVTAMIDRGNMALEDRKWKEAEDFFNRALDMDAKCAQAYWGLFLAEKNCSSPEDYIAMRREELLKLRSDTEKQIACEEDCGRVQAAVEKYAIKGYLREKTIQVLFSFDRSYESERKYRAEEFFNDLRVDNNFQRAEKYGRDNPAFKNFVDQIRRMMDENFSRIQREDEENIAQIKAAYAQHLDEAEAEAKRLYETALAKREDDYQTACALEAKAKTERECEKAAAIFCTMGDYKDSPQRLLQCNLRSEDLYLKPRYEAACSLLASPEKPWDRDLARYEFLMLGDYRDSREKAEECKSAERPGERKSFLGLSLFGGKEKQYLRAKESYLATGDKEPMKIVTGNTDGRKAIVQLLRLLDFDKDPSILEKIASTYEQASEQRRKGELRKAYHLYCQTYDYKQSIQYTAKWNSNHSLAVGTYHTVGLRSDGTVVTTAFTGKRESILEEYHGQCEVSGWRDIVAIAAGDAHTVGLRSDGTVVATKYVGNRLYNNGQCEVSGWRDIVAIAVGWAHTVGLRSDGTVVAVGFSRNGECEVSDWTDIVAIAAGVNHTVGLLSDGTVVATKYTGNQKYYHGQSEVSDWRDIIAIAAGGDCTLGLRSDGTVVAVGSNNDGVRNVSDWTDIVAIATEGNCAVGLRSDGTVVATGDGYNKYTQCGVANWHDIVSVAAGAGNTVGLRSDGTVVAVRSYEGQCNVSDWTDIRLPSL